MPAKVVDFPALIDRPVVKRPLPEAEAPVIILPVVRNGDPCIGAGSPRCYCDRCMSARADAVHCPNDF